MEKKSQKKWVRAPKDGVILAQDIENEIDVYKSKKYDIDDNPGTPEKKQTQMFQNVDHHNNLDFYYCYKFHVSEPYFQLLKSEHNLKKNSTENFLQIFFPSNFSKKFIF